MRYILCACVHVLRLWYRWVGDLSLLSPPFLILFRIVRVLKPTSHKGKLIACWRWKPLHYTTEERGWKRVLEKDDMRIRLNKSQPEKEGIKSTKPRYAFAFAFVGREWEWYSGNFIFPPPRMHTTLGNTSWQICENNSVIIQLHSFRMYERALKGSYNSYGSFQFVVISAKLLKITAATFSGLHSCPLRLLPINVRARTHTHSHTFWPGPIRKKGPTSWIEGGWLNSVGRSPPLDISLSAGGRTYYIFHSPDGDSLSRPAAQGPPAVNEPT